MKTQLKALASVGIKPILLMIGETVFLVALVLLLLHWGGVSPGTRHNNQNRGSGRCERQCCWACCT